MKPLLYNYLMLALITVSGCATTHIEAVRDPDTGAAKLYFNSPKEYGAVKAHVEYDDQGNAKSLHFEAEGVQNSAAKQQADSFTNLINALERAYTRTPQPAGP